MYRFRSVENLIGKYQELEKQQIYFASTDELNDPLEGTRNYFWQGDEIIWKNMFKHYLLCLNSVAVHARLLPDDQGIQNIDIPIFLTFSELTDVFKKKIEIAYDIFFSNTMVKAVIPFLVKHQKKIYRDDLYVYLKLIHNAALRSMFESDIQFGLLPESTVLPHSDPPIPDFLLDSSDQVGEQIGWESYSTKVLPVIRTIWKAVENGMAIEYQHLPKTQSIFQEFPQMYLDSIGKLTYPNGYVACFMDNCLDPAIWGTYGNSHSGVCLKFNTGSENTPFLTLKKSVGEGSDKNGERKVIYNDFPHLLKPINYSSDFLEVDFFRNLGALTTKALHEWYTDEKGSLSVCGEGVFKEQEDWRTQYWQGYEGAYLTKLPEWSREKEYRIIISSNISLFKDPKDRVLEYKFEDLQEIIFGKKTSTGERVKIIDIIKRKSESTGSNHVSFYEMDYSVNMGGWYKRKLILK